MVVSAPVLVFVFQLLAVLGEKIDTPPVRINDIYNDGGWEGENIPLINMRDYLKLLSHHVAEKRRFSLIIVGPKNSGKSKGIQEMIIEWEKQGRIVLDIDLKGKGNNVTAGQVLAYTAMKTYKKVDKAVTFSCLYEYIRSNCSEVLPEMYSWQFVSIMWKNGGAIVAIVSIFVSNVALIELCIANPTVSKRLCYYTWIAALLVVIFYGVISSYMGYVIGELLHSLNQTISSGDWETLRCSYNGITQCLPENQPILIIREFVNFEEQSRLDLFRSLEGLKQGKFEFPVILETSDFLWIRDQSVIKSSQSFQPHFMKEMTYEKGKEETVEGYKLWTLEEFDKVYEALGGHTGSYQLLWSVMKGRGYNLDESIKFVKMMSYSHLYFCVNVLDDQESVESFLCILKLNDYELMMKERPKVVSNLMKENILFMDMDGTIYPQTRPLKQAIETYITKFNINCSALLVQ